MGGLAHATKPLSQQDRVDVVGLGPGAAMWSVARDLGGAGSPRPTVHWVLARDQVQVQRLAGDLRFAMQQQYGTHPACVRTLPEPGRSPFLELSEDRRALGNKLSILSILADSQVAQKAALLEPAPRFVVVSAAQLLRKGLAPERLLAHRIVVEAEEECSQEDLLMRLTHAGYTRVPVAEDPGTFASRGNLVDVYPHGGTPVRIEFDDWLVLRMRTYDSATQRTQEEVTSIVVPPAQEFLDVDEAQARRRVRDLCDEANYPSTKSKALIEELLEGHHRRGASHYLPAVVGPLVSPLAYLFREEEISGKKGTSSGTSPGTSPGTSLGTSQGKPPGTSQGTSGQLLIVDPPGVLAAVQEHLEDVQGQRQARVDAGLPTAALEDHYTPVDAWLQAVEQHRCIYFHGASMGTSSAHSTAAERFEQVSSAHLRRYAPTYSQITTTDTQGLATEIQARRKQKQADVLAPLMGRISQWHTEGMAVHMVAHTPTQAERLRTMLRTAAIAPEGADDSTVVGKTMGASHPTDVGIAQEIPSEVDILVGPLMSSFVYPEQQLCFVSTEEIFGSETNQRGRRRPPRRLESTLEDLRELEPGDYVVHVDHGVGRYVGLERKSLGQSQLDQLQGKQPLSVEVLVVEYAKGDRLFLPVTRLNQIQRLSGKEGHTPKIDRLGGQSFTSTKTRVKKQVREMADELLRLYAERVAHERPGLPNLGTEYHDFEARFPYEETVDQARAIDEVNHDLEQRLPMDRLICGDVGFGKTEVAIRAVFRVAMAGKQIALLCPTTVLAQQHFNTFQERFKDYPIQVRLLSRFVDRDTQRQSIQDLKEGKADLVIGTHRLLSKDVHFKNLGLLVVDEEQRFGVTHKERIKQLRREVDVLTLSATPIPRTLQMAVGGLRDLSLITTPPAARRSIRTFVSRWEEHVVRDAVEREMARGGQIFYVYNRIEGLYERGNQLKEILPGARIGVAHGQMKENELERVMTDFVSGEYDVLCSTAIVESGLDIPRANTILIDRADLFGLSQLYQLRGRVGRSSERAYCYLFTPPPSKMTDDARYRIEALERHSELGAGFRIASLDMELRGAGDALGAEQSGNMALVGFELFLQMLREAVAELRGEPIVIPIDPEVTLEEETHLPENYIDDIGVRLSFYKRFAGAQTMDEVQDLTTEMEERYGPAEGVVSNFVRAMELRPGLMHLRALGCEARANRVTLHLREDTGLDPAKVMERVTRSPDLWKLTQDMRLTRYYTDGLGSNSPDANAAFAAGGRTGKGSTVSGLERAHQLLDELQTMTR